MILKNMTYGDIKPGDILCWTTNPDCKITPSSDLIVSVIQSGKNMQFKFFNLGSQKFWSSRCYGTDDVCMHMIFRAEP